MALGDELGSESTAEPPLRHRASNEARQSSEETARESTDVAGSPRSDKTSVTQQAPQQTGGTDAAVSGELQKPAHPAATSGPPPTADDTPMFDDFGLPIRPAAAIQYAPSDEDTKADTGTNIDAEADADENITRPPRRSRSSSRRRTGQPNPESSSIGATAEDANICTTATASEPVTEPLSDHHRPNSDAVEDSPRTPGPPNPQPTAFTTSPAARDSAPQTDASVRSPKRASRSSFAGPHSRQASTTSATGVTNSALSEFSHQSLVSEKDKKGGKDGKGIKEKDGEDESSEDGGWKTMPAFAPYDMYDDDDRLIAREHVEAEGEDDAYKGLGGAGKGYTRVLIDDDAESATSMDDNTQYLFKTGGGTSLTEDEAEQRDAVSQMQATKDLLTEGQRIAYVGITRLHLQKMTKKLEDMTPSRRLRKQVRAAADSMRMWSQKMMFRLYVHMDISPAEQVMIEQLSEHGVEPSDLTPALLVNARVNNPMAGDESTPASSLHTPGTPQPHATTRPASSGSAEHQRESDNKQEDKEEGDDYDDNEEAAEPPPPYHEVEGEELLEVRTPSQLPTTAKIDIDLRWTVLCDLFLVLIADSVYDARSRVLLERVGESLDVPWIDICKFEKKVTEALEMQQNAEKENWNEKEHMEARRKLALKRRYVFMGLATVGGGLVIGLSAGLLAPVIGAGLAAGFTTLGVTGTSGFLAGAGGAAIITSSAAASGGVIGGRAANRRTGAVRTFEYRPLHNNKRVNLIVTVSGWMTGKVDDVRLPYSTVDPVMGDIYSVLWEPEMLTTMGDTINILATEALTQGLQQLLGSTILISLMAALQLPVVLTKLSYLIDNPWAVSLDRATMAGLILADSLADRNLGTRPITLVGYSLGSRVIFSCLQELARKGAYGLVQNVFLFGSPIVVKQDEYMRARSVVSGRFVNGYNRSDWILGYLFRLTNGGIRRVAGLGDIKDVPDIENMDVTEFVVGHMDYRTAMPRLLRECGWLVESDEFTEIEDPDPENHAERQRELINEIEEARKELEKESKQGTAKKGGAFSFFSRKKKGEKQEWEIYEDIQRAQRQSAAAGGASAAASGGRIEDADGNNHGVLFDVDAIRAELAREGNVNEQDLEQLEQLQVRELESTLPPMKLDYTPEPSPSPGPSPGPGPAQALPVAAVPATPTPPKPALPRSPRTSLSLGSRRVTDTSVAYRAAGANTHEKRPSPWPRISEERKPSLNKQLSLPPQQPLRPTKASPSMPSMHSMDGGGDGGISMTFDSDYGYNSGNSDGFHADDQAAKPWTSGASSIDTGHMAVAGLAVGAAAGAGAATVPAITLTDPWNEYDDDNDDPDFGKEQEISMTFA